MKHKVAAVILEKTVYGFDKPYDYIIPTEFENSCSVGFRVIVPFGRGNSARQGIIIGINETDDCDKLKSILMVADKTPVLSDEMIKLCLWLHETVFCTYFDAVNAVLPAGIGLKVTRVYSADKDFTDTDKLSDRARELYNFLLKSNSLVDDKKLLRNFDSGVSALLEELTVHNAVITESAAVRRMNDATEKMVCACVSGDRLESIKLTARQLSVAQTLCDIGSVSVKELMYFTGCSVSIVNSLVSKGVARFFSAEVYRRPDYAADNGTDKALELSEEQENAYNYFKDMLCSGKAGLLYGVTGSGKTQVFLKLADDVIKNGKGVIIMVPEISLTPQTISIFNNRYKGRIAVFHSAMSLGQRMDEWKRIKNGEAVVAIGTRSAVFAPFDNLGLIIMDEEQEHTYKSESSPRFHARDVARFRAAYNKCLFLMASATPSVETYAAAKIGKYALKTLSQRYGKANLPTTEVVDMKKELLSGNSGEISNTLYNEIDTALKDGRQAIVLLNRRGHNTYISCPNCSAVATCPNCSVSLTYHSANHRLMCHYCDYSVPVYNKCPTCGNEHLHFSGAGTQKVEEELKMLFENARILRIDADSTMTRGSLSSYLTDFKNGKYDIMLGTQMVSKGLNFPNVTIVGVLGADKASNSADYRSVERTFDLLTQVIGRAGRGDFSGKAIIQTTDPESNIIALAKNQDYDAFFDEEIVLRKILRYPPYCDIVLVQIRSESLQTAKDTAFRVFNGICTLVTTSFTDVIVDVLRPTPSAMPRINNKYRYKIIIKCRNSKRLREMIRSATDIVLPKDTSLTVDVNPETVI